jgi:hypothetical protein
VKQKLQTPGLFLKMQAVNAGELVSGRTQFQGNSVGSRLCMKRENAESQDENLLHVHSCKWGLRECTPSECGGKPSIVAIQS